MPAWEITTTIIQPHEVERRQLREQRRYEIAKAVMAGLAADTHYEEGGEAAARLAVRWADDLLAELDK